LRVVLVVVVVVVGDDDTFVVVVVLFGLLSAFAWNLVNECSPESGALIAATILTPQFPLQRIHTGSGDETVTVKFWPGPKYPESKLDKAPFAHGEPNEVCVTVCLSKKMNVIVSLGSALTF